MVTFNGLGLGWTFESELDDSTGAPAPSGLALRKVRHDGHNFAQDIRLIGLWVTLEHVDTKGNVLSTEKKFIEVSEKNFQVDIVKTIDPKPVTSVYKPTISRTFDYLKSSQSGLSFSDYFQDDNANYVAYGLAADYAAPALFANLQLDNCDQAGLSIEQTLLLSRYGNDPPHEPSGGLSAARCHPMVAYKLTPNPARDWSKPFVRVASLRFDFRLHLYLDTYLKDKTATGLYNANQAGLFADSDVGSIRAGGRLVSGAAGNIALSQGVSKLAFYAVEKPVVREVVAPGLIEGDPTGDLPNQKDVVCWDNIHWWGAAAPGQPIISTPGAFHAAHIHWRWGAALKSWAARLQASSWRRFQPGDALIDPRTRFQDIFVAITKYKSALDPMRVPLQNLTAENWADLFNKNNAPSPALIKDGGDLVLWYCSEVHRRDSLSPPEGAVFLHGIFFAHNVEPGGISLTVGSREPQHRPRTESDLEKNTTQWFRSAND